MIMIYIIYGYIFAMGEKARTPRQRPRAQNILFAIEFCHIFHFENLVFAVKHAFAIGLRGPGGGCSGGFFGRCGLALFAESGR